MWLVHDKVQVRVRPRYLYECTCSSADDDNVSVGRVLNVDWGLREKNMYLDFEVFMERRFDSSHSFTEFRLDCRVVKFVGVESWCKSSMSSAKRKKLGR